VIVAALACGCGAEPRSVLLVTIDTLRADHVGAYGYAAARTPTLDRLAATGVRFEQAVSPAPITLVSHASLLTGKIPPRHGVRDNGAYRLRDEHVTLPERLHQAGFATGAFVGAYVLDASFDLDQGFEVYDDRMTGERSASIGYAERSAAAVADAASAWIRELPPEQPFFAWIHFYDPHANYTPPPGFAAAFPGRPYDAEIAYTDFQLGRLLEALASPPRRAETLVVVTSDHGESLGEHGEPTHTHFVYDATQRVPLILSGPGVPRGAVVATQVRLIDVAPTVLDLVRLPPLEAAQGVSLVPVMRSGAASPADAYVETLATRNLGWSPLAGLRSGGWKYIRAPRPELYELSEDPGELVNRISERPNEAARLREKLDAMLHETPASETVALDREGRERLEALGYVAPRQAHSDDSLVFEGIDPKDGIAAADRLNRASGLLEAARFHEALELVMDLRRDFPDAPLYRSLEALVRLRIGDAKRAAELIAEVNRKSPDDSDAWELRAGAEAALGRFDEARRALDEARRSHPESPRLHIAAVVLELDAGNPEAARRRVDAALDRDPSDLDLLVALGRVQEAEGRTEEARRSYRGVVERSPAHPTANLRLALLEITGGELEGGARRLENVPAELRAPLSAALEIAQAFAGAGERERAADALNPLMQPELENAAAWDAYGALLLELDRIPAAEAALRRALALDPGRLTAVNNLAWLLAREGRDLDLALRLAQEAAAAAPGPVTTDTLAEVYLARGEPEPALAATGRGLETTATGDAAARLHYLRGRALRDLGRREEASESFARAVAGASDRSDAWVAEAEMLRKSL
jgi:arylsulfatase A-like enzyme/Flp pilus assembly protein TadD